MNQINEVGKHLGQGGQGQVIEVQFGSELLAAKFQQNIRDDEYFLLRQLMERKQNHIIEIKSVSQYQQHNVVYEIIMELGQENLYQHVQSSQFLQQKTNHKLNLCFQAAKGVNELQQLGYFHRDLKPENFVLTEQNQLKLIDFGLVRKIEAKNYTMGIGTAQYMAPEMIQNQHYSPQIDVWALGLIFYFVFTSNDFFQGNGMQEIKDQIIQISQEEINSRISSENIPENIQNLILNMLKINPKERIPIEIAEQEIASIIMQLRSKLINSLQSIKQQDESEYHQQISQIDFGFQNKSIKLSIIEKGDFDQQCQQPEIQVSKILQELIQIAKESYYSDIQNQKQAGLQNKLQILSAIIETKTDYEFNSGCVLNQSQNQSEQHEQVNEVKNEQSLIKKQTIQFPHCQNFHQKIENSEDSAGAQDEHQVTIQQGNQDDQQSRNEEHLKLKEELTTQEKTSQFLQVQNQSESYDQPISSTVQELGSDRQQQTNVQVQESKTDYAQEFSEVKIKNDKRNFFIKQLNLSKSKIRMINEIILNSSKETENLNPEKTKIELFKFILPKQNETFFSKSGSSIEGIEQFIDELQKEIFQMFFVLEALTKSEFIIFEKKMQNKIIELMTEKTFDKILYTYEGIIENKFSFHKLNNPPKFNTPNSLFCFWLIIQTILFQYLFFWKLDIGMRRKYKNLFEVETIYLKDYSYIINKHLRKRIINFKYGDQIHQNGYRNIFSIDKYASDNSKDLIVLYFPFINNEKKKINEVTKKELSRVSDLQNKIYKNYKLAI